MHITIVGGGVIGLTSAYRLARDGAEVRLVDARATGLGASDINAGWVCPADAAPVPGPGMVGQGLKWMLRSDSPLYIKPSLDPAHVAFMIRMRRHCNRADYRAGIESLLHLCEETMDGYDEYQRDGVEFEMHADGLLMAFLSAGELGHHQEHLDIVESFGLEPRVLVGDDARKREPALSDAVYGSIHVPSQRHIDPGSLMRGLRRRCEELSVEFVEGAPIDGVENRGTSVAAVRSGSRRFASDAFVLAAGAWSGPISKLFGVGLPVRPGKGYSLDLPPFELRSPVYLAEARVATTPLDDRLRLAGTMEFGSLNEKVDPVRVSAIARAPALYFRDWAPANEPRAGAGMRPMTPDGLPIIGRLGNLQNTYVSTGHAMLGVTLAPSSAAALSRLVLEGTASAALDPFSADRF